MLDERFFEKFGVEYSPNEMIFCEFEPGNEFYFIQEGRVQIVKMINNREKTIDVLTVGDVFGEMAILEEQPRSASAIAMNHVKLLRFHRDNFDALLHGNPQLAYKLLVIFSKRIYDAKRRLMILLLDEPLYITVQTVEYVKFGPLEDKFPVEEVEDGRVFLVDELPHGDIVLVFRGVEIFLQLPPGSGLYSLEYSLGFLEIGRNRELSVGSEEYLVGRVQPFQGVVIRR